MSLQLPDWRPQAPLELLCLDWLERAAVAVAVLRLERIDPLISGNKWFKLAPYLAAAAAVGAEGLISLGGPHSNHLHALAAAGQRFGFTTVGLLRGTAQDTQTLDDLRAFGMQLHWLGYGGYRARHQPDFWEPWRARYPGLYPVPEGGGGVLGAQGCAVLVEQARAQLAGLGWTGYDGWWLAAGTGTTLAGLVLAEAGAHPVFGALALPADHGVDRQVEALLAQAGIVQTEMLQTGMAQGPYQLLDASRGAFAKVDEALARFMLDTEGDSGLLLEPLYTAKALLALRTQVEAGYFARGTRLLFVHTGGLQGRRALMARVNLLAAPAAGYTEG